MHNEITIKTQSVLQKLHKEAERTGVDPFILIEGFIVKGIALNNLKLQNYLKGVQKVFDEIQGKRSELILGMFRETLSTRKPAVQENLDGLGVDLTITRITGNSNREDMYNREYDIFITHPSTKKIVKFNLYYALGILMSMTFDIIELDSSKKSKIVVHHSKKYKIDDPDNVKKMRDEIKAHLNTLMLECV